MKMNLNAEIVAVYPSFGDVMVRMNVQIGQMRLDVVCSFDFYLLKISKPRHCSCQHCSLLILGDII